MTLQDKRDLLDEALNDLDLILKRLRTNKSIIDTDITLNGRFKFDYGVACDFSNSIGELEIIQSCFDYKQPNDLINKVKSGLKFYVDEYRKGFKNEVQMYLTIGASRGLDITLKQLELSYDYLSFFRWMLRGENSSELEWEKLDDTE